MSEPTIPADQQEALDYLCGLADIGLAAMQPAVRAANVKIAQSAHALLSKALTSVPVTTPAPDGPQNNA